MSFNKKIRKLAPNFLYDIYAYYKVFKRIPNLFYPKLFNEKINRRKYFGLNYFYANCADKYIVRDYIKNKIGEDYLVPIVKVINYENIHEIKEIELKNTVVKANHGAGMVAIFHESIRNDEYNDWIKLFQTWLEDDYGVYRNEFHYSMIKQPLLLVEKSLCENGIVPTDYKFHCFNKYDGSYNYVLQIVNGRFGNESRGYYLNNLDNCAHHHGGDDYQIKEHEKEALLKIIELNKMIIQDFDYARIDWYVVDGNVYFGEITLTPGAGFVDEFGKELETKMGNMWL